MDFFILGNPRSGTTLIRVMLNSHSKIGVPPECGMIQWWYNKYKNWAKDNSISERDFINDIYSSKKIEDWNISKKDIAEVFKSNPKSYSHVFNLLYRNYTGKGIIGDKNNYYIHHLQEINEIYPNTKYIHLVRDGRDIACSYLKINTLDKRLKYLPKVSNSITEIANEWSTTIKKIDAFMEDKNALVVKYEDLLVEPKKILTEVCDFLGQCFETKMLEYFNNINEPKSTLNWKEKIIEPIDRTNFNKFKNILTKEQIKVFNGIAYDMLKKYKYVT
jgi:hypothetical protein